MPVIYDTPIVEQKTINSSEIVGFSVNHRDSIFDVMYNDGRRDAGGVFTPIGEMKNLHLSGQAVIDIITANPLIYAGLKTLINDLIMESKGVAGTIV